MKSIVLLAGALLLVAGCSNDLTSPTSPVRGGAAAVNAKSKQPTTATSPRAPTANAQDSQGECRAGYSVSSGREDSVCLDDIQQ